MMEKQDEKRAIPREQSGGIAAPTSDVHFWEAGPQDVIRLASPRYDHVGRGLRFDWLYRWQLGRVEGVSRSKALSKIWEVLHHPLSWERAGVHWSRSTTTLYPPQIVINVLPAAQSACGEGSAGCYEWGGGLPIATLGVEYIDDPRWWALLVNMELCGHGTFRMLDMYSEAHQPYLPGGTMGTFSDASRTSFYPSDVEIRAARDWLAGRVPPERIHED